MSRVPCTSSSGNIACGALRANRGSPMFLYLGGFLPGNACEIAAPPNWLNMLLLALAAT